MSQKPRDRKVQDREAKRSFTSRKLQLQERGMLDRELSGNEFRFLALVLKHLNEHTLIAILGDDNVRAGLVGFASTASCWRAREKLRTRGYFDVTPGSGRRGTRYDFSASLPAETLSGEKGSEASTSENPFSSETPALARQQAVHLHTFTPSKNLSDEDEEEQDNRRRERSLRNRTCYVCETKATHEDPNPDHPDEIYVCDRHASDSFGKTFISLE